jgi:hypothetical protein
MDAGVMLAHTLWRKVLSGELELADKYLNDLIYEFLQAEQWTDARRVAEFRVAQKKTSSDLSQKMAIVNLAIAHKFSGSDKYKGLLKKIDWSSSAPEFKMASAVLLDDFDSAGRIMQAIGKEGELVTESAYHSWPLFKHFRESDIFLNSYLEIYGRAFVGQAEKQIEGDAADLRGAMDNPPRQQ